MRGIDVVQAITHRVVIGEDNCYCWRRRVIVLTRETALGTDAPALVTAAHEVAHILQPQWLFWLRWLQPVRDHIEADAWRRAVEILKSPKP